jgi:putative ABC transport system permease protein
VKAPRWFRRLPMSTPLAHVSGSAWRMFARLFALGAIAAIGLAIAVGAFSAIDSVFSARDRWYEQGHVADLELRVAAADAGAFPDFGDVPGVADHRTRMVFTGSVRAGGPDSDPVSLLAISSVRDSAAPINSPTLVAGELLAPGDRQGAVVERSLQRYHDVNVGDTIEVDLGERVVPLTVRGVVEDAEFLLAPVNPSLFVPSKGSMGIAYVDRQVLGEQFGFEPVNSVLFRLAPGASESDVRQAVVDKAAASGLTGGYTVSSTEQFSYQFLEKDLAVFRIMLPVIVLVSALSALFVTTFLLVQWVVRERQTLGVFMALGHTPARLSRSFAAVFGALAAGAVVGGLLDAVLVGKVFVANFSTSIGLPAVPLTFTPRYVALGTLAVVVVFALAGAAAVRRVFLMSPRDAMRYTTPSGGKPGGFGRWIGSRLPTTWARMSLRNVFRNPLVSLVTVVSMALGFGITAAFFIGYTSFVGTSIDNVERGTWDLAVDFNGPVDQLALDGVAGAAGVREVVPYSKGVAQTSHNGTRANLYIGAFDPAKPWQAETIVSGGRMSADQPDGMLLEQSTAEKLGVGVGDTLTLDADGTSVPARIVGVFSGALPGEAHLPLDLFDGLAGLGGLSTGAFVRVDGELSAVESALAERPEVQQVLSKKQIAAEILGVSGQVTGILQLGAGISIAIAGLFAFSCLGYTVLRRKDEYQALRLLGYSDRLVTVIIMTEVLALGVAALVLAIPVGAITAGYLNNRLSEAWFHVDTIINGTDYVTTFVPALVLLPLVALPIARSILREPLDSHLRTREIA